MVKLPLIALFVVFSFKAVAEQNALVPVPDPRFSAKVESRASTPASCHKSTIADVYTVKDLTVCGQRINNSGLGGLFNRGNRCAIEKTVAHVFAAPCTCEDCGSTKRRQEIRCQRANSCSCQDEQHIKVLITDLMDGSRKVRRAAVHSLRQCGFRVDHERDCVEEEVPSAVFY